MTEKIEMLAQSVRTEATNGIESYKQNLITYSELIDSIILSANDAMDIIRGKTVNSSMINKGHSIEKDNGGDMIGTEANLALKEFERYEINSQDVRDKIKETIKFVTSKKED